MMYYQAHRDQVIVNPLDGGATQIIAECVDGEMATRIAAALNIAPSGEPWQLDRLREIRGKLCLYGDVPFHDCSYVKARLDGAAGVDAR